MDLIPVIDLKDGMVVHAVGGVRERYRPVESLIAADARPTTVARAFFSLGFRTVYVADLDAIGGSPEDRLSYERIWREGLHLWIDAGVDAIDRVYHLAKFADCHVVLGSESLPGLEFVQQAISAIGSDRIIVSLDLKAERVLSRNPQWQTIAAYEIACEVMGAGLEQVILLDLDHVGTEAGVGVTGLCSKILKTQGQVRVYVGGGISSEQDLKSLEAIGCHGALVSTALHRRKLPFLHD